MRSGFEFDPYACELQTIRCPVRDGLQHDAVEQCDALVLCLQDLVPLRRHIRLGFQAEHGEFLAMASGGACDVHRRAAATNDDDALTALEVIADIALLEVCCTLDHPGLRVIELWQPFRHRGTGGDEDRREFRAQFLEVGMRTDARAGPDIDAEFYDPLDFGVEDVLGKAIRWNTIVQHATELRLRLEQRDRIAHPAQMEGRGQPRRAAADDGDCFRV